MEAEIRSQLAFHATGKRSGALERVDDHGLRPALLGAYRDLTSLRYDFPVVLVPGGSGVRSLTAVIDEVLQKIAEKGAGGEKMRRQLLRLEQEIRKRVAAGEKGTLSSVWGKAAADLAARTNDDFSDCFRKARAALDVDGELVDCDAALPARLVAHAWRLVQEERLERLAARIERLILKLSDILQADAARSQAGRSPDSLARAMGSTFVSEFDFDAMAKVLTSAGTQSFVPESRRRRIKEIIELLKRQPYAKKSKKGQSDPLESCVFDACEAALAALRQRQSAVLELVKAFAIAELEIEGRYVESEHDAFFAAFDESSLGRADLSLFPDYLVCLRVTEGRPESQASITAALSCGLPIKVLAQIDDILGEARGGAQTFGFAAARLGTMAVALDDVFVLQASAANLHALRDGIRRGMTFGGSALFSVFAGRGGNGLPNYLSAAAATQSRAFPAFIYDPAAGGDLASRFHLEENPQPEKDWPTHDLVFEDEAHQRASETLTFTFADFVATDGRYAGHFAGVPAAKANGGLVPVAAWLEAGGGVGGNTVPYTLLIDDHHALHKVIADEAVTTASRRCRDLWHRVQELGGVHNSHAEQLLAKEKSIWEEKHKKELASITATAAAAPVTVSAEAPRAEAAPVAEPVAEPAQKSDDPYIETLRCTTCNECTNINNRMFAYNENKQAYIADVSAGTYRELVEAAESCQVAIIHPGKPKNMSEPELEHLMKRAELFN